jgi:hypothetical protein
MGCSPGLELAGGKAKLPDHHGTEAAPLSFNAWRRRLGFAALRWAGVQRRVLGPIKGRSGSWACVPGLAWKSRR